MRITGIKARKIFNSRGSPTIEVEISTQSSCGRVEAPSGASTGSHEVAAYPLGGVDEAVRIVNEVIATQLIGRDVENQTIIDQLLHEIDGTPNFGKIGGNTSIAISLAVPKAAAASTNIPFFKQLSRTDPVALPHPLGNVLGGGKHAGGKAPDIQEFLALPMKAASFAEAAWANICVHGRVRELLETVDATFTGGKGDEGAWAPNLDNNKALEVVSTATRAVTDELGVDVRVGLDVASSSLWDVKKKSYIYCRETVNRSPGEQIDYILDLIKTYSLKYVEDPFHEEDFESFSELTKKAKTCMICGDDLFTTNPERLRHGAQMKAGNAIIIKPNQIGTLTETFEAVQLAKRTGYIPVASHRSGEACDTYLAHLAVGLGCPIIKVGVVGGER
ncbi:phosphopyruvate hydratase, partial [Candidatus Bathyarchaeota archaeon]|nr:phosphopyruvate hydratase [Candidatus Bathyarchaeota archaeon]